MTELDSAWAAGGRLDQTTRGIPAGITLADRDIGSFGWRPTDGSVSLPILTMRLGTYEANATAFLKFAADAGVLLAPHTKTPMIPELARSLVERGAWGATVANPHQLGVILDAGIDRVIVASPPGGTIGCSHLVRTLALTPEAEVYVFLDSVEGVAALHQVLANAPNLRVRGLIEVGFGRTGARTLGRCIAIRDAILRTDGVITLAGVGCYEAAAITTADSAQAALSRLFSLVAETYRAAVEEVGTGDPMIITAGGSLYFNEVIAALKPLVADRAGSDLILRSGSLFFSDDGPYKRSFAAMAERGLAIGAAIEPVLSLWAEILSRPEDGLAIAGFGKRDAPDDLGQPMVKRVFRDGQEIPIGRAKPPVVEKLNDQHAFIVGGWTDALKVGDVVEFGIAHPCTALQRWRVVFGLGPDGTIVSALRTRFG